MDNTDVLIADKTLRMCLLNARKSKKLTQKELSELSGLSIATISNIESGDGSPTMRSIIRYSDAVGYKMQVKKKLEDER